MLRFLKKHKKYPNKPVPPESPARQTIDIGAKPSRDSEGEYRPRKISELIRSDGTDLTTVPGTNRRGGSRIANQDGRIRDQQLPAQNSSTPTPSQGGGDASECSWLQPLVSMFIPHLDSVARARPYAWRLRRSAKRATRSQHSQSPLR